jgi:DNA invertase Pin-like site-specific DNA recombinase
MTGARFKPCCEKSPKLQVVGSALRLQPEERKSADKQSKIADARGMKAAGSTYQEIAEALNISKGTVSKWLAAFS